jgi:hypothetical protein
MKLKGLMTLLLMASMVPASATIARLKALGMTETDNEGSYYIDDDRNILLNVANINSYGDTVILELGNTGNGFEIDADNDALAKGGVLKKSGDYTYGVYLGGESNTSKLLRIVGTSNDTNSLEKADNQLELFLGSKASFGDWGVSVVYTDDHAQTTTSRRKDNAHAVKLGARGDKWDVLANISTGTYVERVDSGTVNYFDGKLGFHLGGGYQVTDNGRVYGLVKKFDWEQYALAFAPDKVDGGFLTYALGYGSEYKHGKGTLFTSIEYRHKEVSADFSTKTEAKNVLVPLTVAYEYAATSWLTLRGSVIQNLHGYRENNNYSNLTTNGNTVATAEFGANTNGKKQTIANSTDVRAGASFNFGKLRIDGLIGVGGTDGTINAAALQENGALDLDRLLARVGMVYSF